MKLAMRPVRQQVYAVVLVCTPEQWDEVRSQFTGVGPGLFRGREFLSRTYGTRKVVFLRAGSGPIATAAAAQFAIDRWDPGMLLTTEPANGELTAIEEVAEINGAYVAPDAVHTTALADSMPEVLDSAREALDQYRTR